MLRIARLTDYAIVALSHLAREHAKRPFYTARELAEESRLPIPTVGKILKTLSKRGLLVSQRGKLGGYGLARLPREISVAEIIAAMEGPIALTECNTSPSTGCCELEPTCPTRDHWRRINSAVGEALGRLSLEQMSRPAGNSGALVMLAGLKQPQRKEAR